MKPVRRQVDVWVYDPLLNRVEKQVRWQVEDQVDDQVWAQVEEQVWDQIEKIINETS